MTIWHRYLNSCTPLVACKKENEKYKIIVLLLFKCLLGTALEYLYCGKDAKTKALEQTIETVWLSQELRRLPKVDVVSEDLPHNTMKQGGRSVYCGN